MSQYMPQDFADYSEIRRRLKKELTENLTERKESSTYYPNSQSFSYDSALWGLFQKGKQLKRRKNFFSPEQALKYLTKGNVELKKEIKKILSKDDLTTFNKGGQIYELLKEKGFYSPGNLKYVNTLLKYDFAKKLKKTEITVSFRHRPQYILKKRKRIIQSLLTDIIKAGVPADKTAQKASKLVELLSKYASFDLKNTLNYELKKAGFDKKEAELIKDIFENRVKEKNQDIFFFLNYTYNSNSKNIFMLKNRHEDNLNIKQAYTVSAKSLSAKNLLSLNTLKEYQIYEEFEHSLNEIFIRTLYTFEASVEEIARTLFVHAYDNQSDYSKDRFFALINKAKKEFFLKLLDEQYIISEESMKFLAGYYTLLSTKFFDYTSADFLILPHKFIRTMETLFTKEELKKYAGEDFIISIKKTGKIEDFKEHIKERKNMLDFSKKYLIQKMEDVFEYFEKDPKIEDIENFIAVRKLDDGVFEGHRIFEAFKEYSVNKNKKELINEKTDAIIKHTHNSPEIKDFGENIKGYAQKAEKLTVSRHTVLKEADKFAEIKKGLTHSQIENSLKKVLKSEFLITDESFIKNAVKQAYKFSFNLKENDEKIRKYKKIMKLIEEGNYSEANGLMDEMLDEYGITVNVNPESSVFEKKLLYKLDTLTYNLQNEYYLSENFNVFKDISTALNTEEEVFEYIKNLEIDEKEVSNEFTGSLKNIFDKIYGYSARKLQNLTAAVTDYIKGDKADKNIFKNDDFFKYFLNMEINRLMTKDLSAAKINMAKMEYAVYMLEDILPEGTVDKKELYKLIDGLKEILPPEINTDVEGYKRFYFSLPEILNVSDRAKNTNPKYSIPFIFNHFSFDLIDEKEHIKVLNQILEKMKKVNPSSLDSKLLFLALYDKDFFYFSKETDNILDKIRKITDEIKSQHFNLSGKCISYNINSGRISTSDELEKIDAAIDKIYQSDNYAERTKVLKHIINDLKNPENFERIVERFLRFENRYSKRKRQKISHEEYMFNNAVRFRNFLNPSIFINMPEMKKESEFLMSAFFKDLNDIQKYKALKKMSSVQDSVAFVTKVPNDKKDLDIFIKMLDDKFKYTVNDKSEEETLYVGFAKFQRSAAEPSKMISGYGKSEIKTKAAKALKEFFRDFNKNPDFIVADNKKEFEKKYKELLERKKEEIKKEITMFQPLNIELDAKKIETLKPEDIQKLRNEVLRKTYEKLKAEEAKLFNKKVPEITKETFLEYLKQTEDTFKKVMAFTTKSDTDLNIQFYNNLTLNPLFKEKEPFFLVNPENGKISEKKPKNIFKQKKEELVKYMPIAGTIIEQNDFGQNVLEVKETLKKMEKEINSLEKENPQRHP